MTDGYEIRGPGDLPGAHLYDYGGTKLKQAVAWVEAENNYAIHQVKVRWFYLMEQGLADLHRPDPFDDTISPELADLVVADTDADYEEERSRWPEGRGPEFSRLSPSARMAFAQELARITQSDAQIEAEAQTRLAAGETLPPAEVST